MVESAQRMLTVAMETSSSLISWSWNQERLEMETWGMKNQKLFFKGLKTFIHIYILRVKRYIIIIFIHFNTVPVLAKALHSNRYYQLQPKPVDYYYYYYHVQDISGWCLERFMDLIYQNQTVFTRLKGCLFSDAMSLKLKCNWSYRKHLPNLIKYYVSQ